MPTNDFKPFACGGSANVESQATYASDAVVTSGFQSGIANSSQVNKVLRQCSIVASMIAQFIVDNSSQNATDDGTTATLENNLKTSINNIISTFVANALGTGGTVYSPHFASVQAQTLDNGGTGGQIRLVFGNYGVIFRNDGGTLWILLTNSGNQSGTFNSLRPFAINLATGAVSIDGTGAGTTFGGGITSTSASHTSLSVSGAATFGSSVTAPNPATNDNSTRLVNSNWVLSQAYAPTSWVNANFPNTGTVNSAFAASYGANGYQKIWGGLILQWGVTSVGTTQPIISNFPIAFPNTVLTIVGSDRGDPNTGTSGSHSVTVQPILGNNAQLKVFGVDSTGAASPTNVAWFAVGY